MYIVYTWSSGMHDTYCQLECSFAFLLFNNILRGCAQK